MSTLTIRAACVACSRTREVGQTHSFGYHNGLKGAHSQKQPHNGSINSSEDVLWICSLITIKEDAF